VGKYDKVLPTLPKLPPDNPKFQEKVEHAKGEFLGKGSMELAKIYRGLRAEEEILDQQVKALNVRIEACVQHMESVWEAEGLRSLKFDTGGGVGMKPQPFARVTDKEAFRDWCVKHGFGAQLSLPWQSTNSITKERLLAGEGEPPGVTAFIKTTFVLTKR
jgi:hypothetical protein